MKTTNLYIKIAHWYYAQKMTQEEIAKRLNTTRQKINHIISLLPEMGIVSVSINQFDESNVALESKIEETFHIKRAIVVETYGKKDFLPELAERASNYMEETIKKNMTIGVSWGETLAASISRMSFLNRQNCKVVQMVGAQNIDSEMIKSDDIARSLSEKLSCVSYMLYAPVVLEKEMTKESLMKERAIRHTFDIIKQCDVAFVGIGQLDRQATMYRRGLMTLSDIQSLRHDGFIADLCMNPIKSNGSHEDCKMRKRIISANMDLLKNIPEVVAIAGGEDKTQAIKACLKSGAVDTLIIDDKTAALMMNS